MRSEAGRAEGTRRAIDRLEKSVQSRELTVSHVGFIHFAVDEEDTLAGPNQRRESVRWLIPPGPERYAYLDDFA